jgi:hypothetical protein
MASVFAVLGHVQSQFSGGEYKAARFILDEPPEMVWGLDMNVESEQQSVEDIATKKLANTLVMPPRHPPSGRRRQVDCWIISLN